MPINCTAANTRCYGGSMSFSGLFSHYRSKQLQLLLLLLLTQASVLAQRSSGAEGLELVLGVGGTYFSGDLGADGPTSIDGNTSGAAFQGGLRYHITNRVAVRGTFAYAQVKGFDSLSSSQYRKQRNLDFKSNVFGFAATLEYSLLNWNFRNGRTAQKKYITKKQNLYVFAGVSIMTFRPYGSLYGQWYSLPELSTAGQGLPGGPSEYKLNTLAIPIGAGYKYLLGRGISLGAELVFNKTFTDDMDDVSASYYNNTSLRQLKGDIAAEIADKNRFPGGIKRPGGEPRGNPSSTDNYSVLYITLNIKLKGSKRGDACYAF
ncbi:MAG: porin family protein [Bacteroidetes bacterium]|nr:MAG: porin family protein [Bacteroidota bacterium]